MSKEIKVLSHQELDDLVPLLLLVEDWVAAVRALMFEELSKGVVFENAVLKPKRPVRKWAVADIVAINELQRVFKLLDKNSSIEAVAPRKVLSVAEAEKAVGKGPFKENLSDYVVAESSGVNLDLITKRN